MTVAVVFVAACIDCVIPHFEKYRQYAKGAEAVPKPAITQFIFAVHPYSFALPVCAVLLAVDILRRKTCVAAYLLWYACGFATLCVFWTAISMLAVYIVDPIFMFGRMWR
jgi:hypothetical protein